MHRGMAIDYGLLQRVYGPVLSDSAGGSYTRAIRCQIRPDIIGQGPVTSAKSQFPDLGLSTTSTTTTMTATKVLGRAEDVVTSRDDEIAVECGRGERSG